MKKRFKLALTVAILMVTFGLLQVAMHLMNMPSDPAFWGGLLLVLGLFVLAPSGIFAIWRK